MDIMKEILKNNSQIVRTAPVDELMAGRDAHYGRNVFHYLAWSNAAEDAAFLYGRLTKEQATQLLTMRDLHGWTPRDHAKHYKLEDYLSWLEAIEQKDWFENNLPPGNPAGGGAPWM